MGWYAYDAFAFFSAFVPKHDGGSVLWLLLTADEALAQSNACRACGAHAGTVDVPPVPFRERVLQLFLATSTACRATRRALDAFTVVAVCVPM